MILGFLGFMFGIVSVCMLCLSEGLARPLSDLFVGYDPSLFDLTLRGFAVYSFSFLFAYIGVSGCRGDVTAPRLGDRRGMDLHCSGSADGIGCHGNIPYSKTKKNTIIKYYTKKSFGSDSKALDVFVQFSVSLLGVGLRLLFLRFFLCRAGRGFSCLSSFPWGSSFASVESSTVGAGSSSGSLGSRRSSFL